MLPRVDHLIQYQVERISTHEKHPAIVFENGVKVLYGEREMKPKLAETVTGSRLISVEEFPEYMVLYFTKGIPGVDKVDFNLELKKGEYMIFDPRYNEILDPHEPQDANAGIAEEPTDRISDGPSDDEVREELARGSQSETEAAGEAQ